MSTSRYLRQVLVPEIGEGGQSRIRAATAHVAGSGLVHEAAERYARGAGFASVKPAPIDVDGLAPKDVVSVRGARELLAASRAVVASLRAALGLEKA